MTQLLRSVWKSPLAVMVVIARAELPLLVKVITCGTPVPFTTTSLNCTTLGETVTALTSPVPESETDCGLSKSLSII